MNDNDLTGTSLGTVDSRADYSLLWPQFRLVKYDNAPRYCSKVVIEGSLEAKLPTIWRDENAGQLGRRSGMVKVRREKIRDGQDQK